MSEKTEQPTSKRLRDARQKGQVAKSADATSAFQLATIALIFVFCGQGWLEEIKQLLDETLRVVVGISSENIARITQLWGYEFAIILVIIAAPLIVVTMLVQAAQVGLVISLEVFANAGNKLNIVNNLKQMFSVKNLFELVKSLIKIVLIGIIFYAVLKDQFSSFQYLSVCGTDCALPLLSHLCFMLFLGLLVGYVFFAAIDYTFQRRTLMKQLMMTKEEIKQEYKDSEGNVEIKQRRREVHRELQNDSMQKKVRKSTVVIKNPTHLSICLWFDAQHCPLPRVIEKAQDEQARKINAFAEREGIPVVENIPLARRLMSEIAVGEFITEEFFEPVAEILRIVMNIPYDPDE
ncbi:MAG: EscU/YscU/HrcU family type III secretion system export apparatus switch protein [Kluyvera sp.]|uniref:EscU/YscU/HrcU family type III secretion system export apparatus switch protein n=1 Tax=Kluyvera sp. TaxID=1538228 RepID=UPI003F370D05